MKNNLSASILFANFYDFNLQTSENFKSFVKSFTDDPSNMDHLNKAMDINDWHRIFLHAKELLKKENIFFIGAFEPIVITSPLKAKKNMLYASVRAKNTKLSDMILNNTVSSDLDWVYLLRDAVIFKNRSFIRKVSQINPDAFHDLNKLMLVNSFFDKHRSFWTSVLSQQDKKVLTKEIEKVTSSKMSVSKKHKI